MKKFAVVLLILGCVSAALSAQAPFGLSAGVGGNFNANFTSHFKNADNTASTDDAMKAANTHMIGGGIYALFDATYVEANAGVLFGNANNDKQDNFDDKRKKGMSVTALKLSLFGKFPIEMQGGLTLFPMAGVDGQINLGGKFYGEEVPYKVANVEIMSKDDFNKMFTYLWFKGGLGIDVPIADKVFIRPEALYGIRLNTEKEAGEGSLKDSTTKIGDTSITTKAPYGAIVGHGLDIRLSVGFKIY
jgi:hypothetical protein